jgi:hypothetical protein
MGTGHNSSSLPHLSFVALCDFPPCVSDTGPDVGIGSGRGPSDKAGLRVATVLS